MEIKREIEIKNEQETRAFGIALAGELKPGDVIALIGDLGCGKTTLTRYIAEGLGIEERVNSPTFTLVKEYEDGRLPLYHFDVYRLAEDAKTLCGISSNAPLNEEAKSAIGDALYNIGAEEYFYGKGVSVIEWADLIFDELPDNTKYIYMEYKENEGERVYKCTF